MLLRYRLAGGWRARTKGGDGPQQHGVARRKGQPLLTVGLAIQRSPAPRHPRIACVRTCAVIVDKVCQVLRAPSEPGESAVERCKHLVFFPVWQVALCDSDTQLHLKIVMNVSNRGIPVLPASARQQCSCCLLPT